MDTVALVAVIMIFGGGTLSYLVKGLLRIAELKATQQQSRSDTEVLRVLEDMRGEIATLRETSTRFDMSFDAALTRLESRVGRLEGDTLTSAETSIGFSGGTGAALPVPTAAAVAPSDNVVVAGRTAG